MNTRFNVPPAMIMELLLRISKIIKDYIGVLTEDAIRKNFVLIYEILDEAVDFGYPQMATSDLIKSFVASQPVILEDFKCLFTPFQHLPHDKQSYRSSINENN